MGADGVDLSFYASRAFLREWKRAFPPMNRPLFVSEHRREISPYAFSSE